MGANSLIQWTSGTFSPWRGCDKVSEGCKHCYAEALVTKRQGLPVWGAAAERKVAAKSTWKNLAKWNKQAAALPDQCLKCGDRLLLSAFPDTDRCPVRMDLGMICGGEVQRNAPYSVFPSLCDIFEDYQGPSKALVDAARLRYFRECELTPNLRHLLLTKRPENVMRMTPVGWRTPHYVNDKAVSSWPANVWIGCTVENQKRAEERLPWLLSIPAPMRFVSYEPALGPVDWTRVQVVAPDPPNGPGAWLNALTGHVAGPDDILPHHIDWLIVGGESGPGARPFDLAWARSAVEQCKASGVSCFVKQLGANPVDSAPLPIDPAATPMMQEILDGHNRGCIEKALARITDRKGGDMAEWPETLRVREIPEAAQMVRS
jgi:protein gp37